MRVTPFQRPQDTPPVPPDQMPHDPRLLGAAAHALDRGLIVFDASCRILACNPAARRSLLALPGMSIVPDTQGPEGATRLRSPAGALQARIERSVQRCVEQLLADGIASPPTVLWLGGGPGFPRMLLRLSAIADTSGPLVVGTLVDPGQAAHGEGALLSELFGLNASASRATETCLSGDSVKQAAHRLEPSASKFKTHLASVYEATGCKRQAQLVRLVMGLDVLRRS
jgi:DNA-binding CsgD family transcriptional regulator